MGRLKRIYRDFKETKLARSAIIVVSIVFALQIILSSVLFINMYHMKINEIVSNNIVILQQANENYLSMIIRQVSEATMDFFYSDTFWDRSGMGSISSNGVYTAMANKLSSLENAESVYLYSSESSILYIMDDSSFGDIPIKSAESNIFLSSNPDLSEKPWYRNAMENDGNVVTVMDKEIRYGSRNVMCFSRCMRYPLLSSSGYYVISINLAEKTFMDLIDQVCNKDEMILIIDEDHNYVYGNIPNASDDTIRAIENASASGKEYSEFNLSGTEYIVVQNSTENIRWSMIKMIPKKSIIGKQFNQYLRNGLISLGIYILGAMALFWVIIHTTHPIKQLSETMRNYNKKDVMGDSALSRRPDEIGVLYRSFDEMNHRIDRLIESEYQSQIQEKQATLEALQAQLDPHFLYNTLQVISGIAIENDITEIEEVNSSLSHILQYSLNKEKSMVKLTEELATVQKYMGIQKYRYGDRIMLQTELSNGIMECYVPVFTLQLAVENSIKHGLEKKIGKETIKIYDDTEGTAIRHIYIVDDGAGASKERIREINKNLQFGKNVGSGHERKGLLNLNERIKRHFGNQYGVAIRNCDPEGAVVTITIPYYTSDRER